MQISAVVDIQTSSLVGYLNKGKKISSHLLPWCSEICDKLNSGKANGGPMILEKSAIVYYIYFLLLLAIDFN